MDTPRRSSVGSGVSGMLAIIECGCGGLELGRCWGVQFASAIQPHQV